MNYMFIWFISGLIFLLACIPVIMFSKKDEGEVTFTPTMAFIVVLVWGFVGAMLVRGYDTGFWYLASIFTVSTLAAAFKKKSQDELPASSTPYIIWIILGLVIPFVVGM